MSEEEYDSDNSEEGLSGVSESDDGNSRSSDEWTVIYYYYF